MAAATDESTPPDMATTMRMIPLRRRDRSRVSGLAGGDLPQPFDDGRQEGDDVVDLFGGVRGAEAEPDRVLGAMEREPHRLQDVRWFQCTRRAGGSGGDRDAFQIEGDQERLRFDAVETDVRRVGDPLLAGAVDDGTGDGGGDAGFEPIAEGGEACRFRL